MEHILQTPGSQNYETSMRTTTWHPLHLHHAIAVAGGGGGGETQAAHLTAESLERKTSHRRGTTAAKTVVQYCHGSNGITKHTSSHTVHNAIGVAPLNKRRHRASYYLE